MVFSSMTFLTIALPLALAVYFLLPRKLRNAWLLLFSLGFYAWGEPVFLLLMLANVTLNYAAGLALDRAKAPAARRALLVLALAVNLGMLFWFKYAGFFTRGVNAVAGLRLRVPKVALPIGISFYTFQALSYTIDVYRGEVPAQRNWGKLALYISFFPQLIAGPILRYQVVAEQLDNRRETLAGFSRGLRRFALGLSKKVLIANTVALVADEAASARALGPGWAWLAAGAYALQIYYDFSGYSDMAIGLGAMFGFAYPENFNDPYVSCTVREFWRRWHISLSTWFRDYLYIPLGGSRVGKARHVLNLLIVFLVTGLWHGATLNFLVWGLYYGVLCAAEALLGVRGGKNPALRACQHVLTLALVLIGWVVFRANTLPGALNYLRAMFTPGEGVLTSLTPRVTLSLAVGAFGATGLFRRWTSRLDERRREALGLLAAPALLLLSLLSLASGAYNPFIYFRF